MYYHIFNGLRGFENHLWPFSKNEFYPGGFGTLSPVYDVLSYITRFLLGFRLGTIISLVSYIALVFLAYKLFELLIDIKKIHINYFVKLLLFLNSVIVTELLFQLATYFVDILDTLIVLLAVYLLLLYVKKGADIFLWTSSLIFGITFLAKETNIIFLIPYLIIVMYEILNKRNLHKKYQIKYILLVCLILFSPILIYDLKNILLTRNPVFPLYNGIFKSEYYSLVSFSPTNYGLGGIDLFQKLFWPIVSFWHASRLSAPHNIFNDWKLGIEWLIALILFLPHIWKRLTSEQHALIFFFYSSMTIWGFTSGVMRYVAVDDVIAGLLLSIVVIQILSFMKTKYYAYILTVLIVSLALIVANYRIVAFNVKYDMSWRPTFVYDHTIYLSQLHNLFNNKLTYQSSTEIKLSSSQITLNCIPQSSGLIALSGITNKPMLNVISQPPDQQMLQQTPYRKIAASKLEKLFNNSELKYSTIIMSDRGQVDFQSCLNHILAAGGTVKSATLLNSFLGYVAYEQPVVIFGSINLNAYLKYKDIGHPIVMQNISKNKFSNQQELLNFLIQTNH
jgi:hypothetical protein